MNCLLKASSVGTRSGMLRVRTPALNTCKELREFNSSNASTAIKLITKIKTHIKDFSPEDS